MNAEQLLTHFDRIADAPDAIPRLRRFILELAVRGKLVEQDPNDEPASELLKRIAAEKRRLVEAGEIKKQNDLPLVATCEAPFSVPDTWEWTRIGSAAYVEMGQSPPSEHYNRTGYGIPFFQGKADFGKRYPTARYWCTQPKKYAAPGDILISVRAPVGPTNIASEICCIGRGLAALRSHQGTDRDYLLRCLESFELVLAALGFGTTFVAINKNQLASFVIPLPPLAEQHRIVAKVDELMVLCDRLETARKEREATRDRLATASLARLNAPDPDSAVFQNHAAFALNNLTPLTTRPDQIKALRQTILNLAVRGKLVEQDPEDEPAGEMLKRIAAEKGRLVKMGKMRDTKSTVEALNEKFPPRLPLNWDAITISQIAHLRSGIALNHGEEQDTGDIPYLKVADLSLVENDKGILTSSRFVGRDRKDDVIESGSIVFPKRGGAIATNRKRRTHVNVVCDSNIMAMKPFAHETLPFLELWFNSFDLWKLNSGTSVPQINNKDIYPLPILLPPLAEQHRIVAKVDELMAVCDRLETSLAAGEETRGRLVEAVLREVLESDRNRRSAS